MDKLSEFNAQEVVLHDPADRKVQNMKVKTEKVCKKDMINGRF